MNPQAPLSGQNVFVTGGTRGIGRAVSLAFARQGAHVLANYVRGQAPAEALLTQAREEGLSIRLCRADLTTERGLADIATALTDMGSPLHCLIHCAATGVHKPFEGLSLRHFDWTFALNVRAFFDLMQRLLPRFAPEASVVVLSSQGSLRTIPAYSLIGASKGALEALARHMAVELAPRGIRVNILAPGAVETEAWDAMPNAKSRLAELAAKTPQGHLVTVEDVAGTAVFLCSPAARSIVGHTLIIDGGASLPV